MNLRRFALFFVGIGLISGIGCDSKDPAPAAQPAQQPAMPANEAAITQKAKDLNALAADELRKLKVGEQAYILVRGRRGGGIYGSGPYTQDSRLETAVIHAGALKEDELGIVLVKVIHHPGEFTSVEQNGVRPNKWPKYPTAYTVEKYDIR